MRSLVGICEKGYTSKITSVSGECGVRGCFLQAPSRVHCFVSWPSPWEPCVTVVESTLDLAGDALIWGPSLSLASRAIFREFLNFSEPGILIY